MADNRSNRDTTSRDKNARYVYTPSSTLPDPTPEPGYVYRWIATHIMGQADPTNVSRKMRDGWVPVKAVDHPELMLEASEKTGNVEIGGLMLCKAPEEFVNTRADYFSNQSKSQMDAVDNNYMKANDPRMPMFSEKKSSVSFGRGMK
jgi:hypothetical protein